jgi:hypothetical protein
MTFEEGETKMQGTKRIASQAKISRLLKCDTHLMELIMGAMKFKSSAAVMAAFIEIRLISDFLLSTGCITSF